MRETAEETSLHNQGWIIFFQKYFFLPLATQLDGIEKKRKEKRDFFVDLDERKRLPRNRKFNSVYTSM